MINKSLRLRLRLRPRLWSRLRPGKYIAVSRITLLTNLAYFTELLWRTVFMSLIIFIFSQLWAVIYSGTGAQSLGGLTYQQMIWYLVMTEAIVLARPHVDNLATSLID